MVSPGHRPRSVTTVLSQRKSGVLAAVLHMKYGRTSHEAHMAHHMKYVRTAHDVPPQKLRLRSACRPLTQHWKYRIVRRGSFNEETKQRNRKTQKGFPISSLVGIPGLEPGKTGPESVVLPLHHIPNCCGSTSPLQRPISRLRVQRYSVFFI